jgi:hypothetical protein
MIGASMDAMNNEGWMCKELRKHENIHQVITPLLLFGNPNIYVISGISDSSI